MLSFTIMLSLTCSLLCRGYIASYNCEQQTARPGLQLLVNCDCGEADCGEGDCGEGEWIPLIVISSFSHKGLL